MGSPQLRLKKIELFGFKSFADRTAFLFDEGITGIVGPNGCGKSNVADAFRWVMGETSAKSLRGEKMGDVIFAGSGRRKPSNFAEVTLTFTNPGGILPVEFEEVVVARRLLRTGESEYRLNGNQVRMKDIHSLFWDSGLGKDAFAIFEQGRIEEIILRNPEERRPIFEQAAGIHAYRQKWREAERKLKQTEGNLTRIHDIVGEVDKQLRVLERQVEEARTYKDNKARFSELDQGLMVARWRRADHNRQKANFELARFHQELEKVEQGRDELDNNRLKARAAVAEREGFVQQALEEVYEIRNAKEVKAVAGEADQKRLEEALGREKALTTEMESIREEQERALSDEGHKRVELEALTSEVATAETACIEGRSLTEGMQEELSSLRSQQAELQQRQAQLVQRSHAVSSGLRETQVRIEGGEERLAHLEKELHALDELMNQQGSMLEERQRVADELSTSVERDKKSLEEVSAELESKTETVRTTQSALDQLLVELTEMRARQKVLSRLKEEGEGLSPATKQLLKDLEGKVRLLSQVVIPKEGYIEAIASVMHPYSQTLLCHSEVVLKEVWRYAQEKGLQGFSLTCPEMLDASGTASGSDLLEGVHQDRVTEALLGQTALVQQTEDFAGGGNRVTKDGVYVDGRGVLFAPARGESNTFQREAELSRLNEQLEEKEARKQALDADLELHTADKERALRMRDELDKKVRQEEMKLVEANFSLQRVRTDVDEAKKKESSYGDERQTLRETLQRLQTEKEELSKQQEEARHALESHQSQFQRIDEKLKEQLDLFEERGAEQRQKEEAYNELSSRLRTLQNSLQLLDLQKEERQRNLERMRQELAQVSDIKDELQGHLAEFDGGLAEVEEELRCAAERLEGAQKHLQAGKDDLSSVEGLVGKAQEERRAVEEQAHRIEIALAQHASHCEDFEEEMRERFQEEMEVAAQREYNLEETLEKTEKELRRLRRIVERSDNINLASIDEFEEAKERHGHLHGQIDDLERSKEEFLKIIEELDKASRQKFEETFEKIRESFRRQFTILFNGGEADLKFVGSDDMLEAGIEIIAKPPGKQPRSIKLLSGGEKCLTAMALLFAIFEEQPAPFCILDEIDAPLDDTNVSRFLQVLKPFMDETQFIIITHNKITMAETDILYGVSMEERGVSKKISIRFDREKAKQEVLVHAVGDSEGS